MELSENNLNNNQVQKVHPFQLPSKLCVRVRFNGEIKCLELDWDKIDAENFTKQCKFCSFYRL